MNNTLNVTTSTAGVVISEGAHNPTQSATSKGESRAINSEGGQIEPKAGEAADTQRQIIPQWPREKHPFKIQPPSSQHKIKNNRFLTKSTSSRETSQATNAPATPHSTPLIQIHL